MKSQKGPPPRAVVTRGVAVVPGADESVGGESLISYNRRPKTFRPGRQCRFDGCATRLSIYNSDEFCARHRGSRAEPSATRLLADQIMHAISDHEEGGDAMEPVPEFGLETQPEPLPEIPIEVATEIAS